MPTSFNGFELPPTARLLLQKIENETYDPIEWVKVADIPSGPGLLLSHSLAVVSGDLNFLEGCYHAYPDRNQSFPGVIISTGTEDYFDSAYYFDAGQFHFEVSGYTHFRQVTNTSLEWSAYRMHDLDPVFFYNGFRFEWRNGDVVDERGFKCIVDKGGYPSVRRTKSSVDQGEYPSVTLTKSTVSSYTWVYVW